MSKERINVVPFIIIGIFVILGVYFLISWRIGALYKPNDRIEDYYSVPNRRVGLNEYSATRVTEEDMAKTYFDTFIMKLFENLDEAYSYLNDEYKKTKASTKKSFEEVVVKLTDNYETLPEMERYGVQNEGDKKVYKVRDKKGNVYVFETSSVMNYKVSLE